MLAIRIGCAAVAAAIEVAGLTKQYGPVRAVDDLSFEVRSGAVTGFLGPNGAGKTTTLRMVLGLARPTAGHATVMGRPYTDLDEPARTVGANLEIAGAHPGRSGRDHLRSLAAMAGLSRGRVEEVLELVELREPAGRRAGKYSMGMRQRLGLAATLLGDPGVLELDEPANGLDPQGIRWLRDFLRSMAAEGRTVLVSSHVLAEVAQTADEVVVIARGRSVAQAPLEELLATRSGGVRVGGPDVGRLAELLRGVGAAVDDAGDGAIVVHDRSGEDIGRLVAEHRIVISELSPISSSLEEIFFQLTGEPGTVG